MRLGVLKLQLHTDLKLCQLGLILPLRKTAPIVIRYKISHKLCRNKIQYKYK